MKWKLVGGAMVWVLHLISFQSHGQESEKTTTSHAVTIQGQPKYGPDFKNFDYVNPNAPKGGNVALGLQGTFDSFNPYIVKGTPSAVSALLYESLMARSQDEAGTDYGLIAESIELPESRTWAVFNLRPEARWHDGKPITAEDVVFSFNILREKGNNLYRTYYADVVRAEVVSERKVRFIFKNGDNPELASIISELPVLPKHYWQNRDFTKPSLDIPLGSGPYKITSFDPGRSVTVERVKDYWGQNLPIRKGSGNFDRITYRYYRDSTVMFEAFKAGEYDWRQENVARQWATGYDIPAVKDGRIVKERIQHEIPVGVQGLVYNIRRPVFQDIRVRQALTYLFDFEWMNKTLFWGQYQRARSYFNNSELASSGLPSPEELNILEPLRGQIPGSVFTKEFTLPVSDGSGNIRNQTRQAIDLLKQAGFDIQNGKMVNQKTSQQMAFEILLNDPSYERLVASFVENAKKLGIAVSTRTIDPSQYQKRVEDFDFDIIMEVFGQSVSPGNEQRNFWGSGSADVPGSENTIGIKNKAIDQLVELIVNAPDRQSLITRTRALDRVLLHHYFIIPAWYGNFYNLAYWNVFGHPNVTPKYAIGFDAWWVDPKKAEALNRNGRK